MIGDMVLLALGFAFGWAILGGRLARTWKGRLNANTSDEMLDLTDEQIHAVCPGPLMTLLDHFVQRTK